MSTEPKNSTNLVQAFYSWYRSTLRHPKYRWLLIGATLLYLFSPVDVLPDVFPIVGWIDDGLVATLLVTEVSQLLLGFLKRSPEKPEQVATTVDVNAEQTTT
ncbi:MAG: YkvA family protein [Elainellaceae cyanobacterium]